MVRIILYRRRLLAALAIATGSIIDRFVDRLAGEGPGAQKGMGTGNGGKSTHDGTLRHSPDKVID
jgi:hypothetical protein